MSIICTVVWLIEKVKNLREIKRDVDVGASVESVKLLLKINYQCAELKLNACSLTFASTLRVSA